MSIFHHGSGPTKLNKVQINQSVLGYALPVVMGKGKVQQSLLWLDGFKVTAAPSGALGKGFGGGKGSQYLYTADVIAALCNGPVTGIGSVWAGQSWLQQASSTETITVPSGVDPTYPPTNAADYLSDIGASLLQPYTGTYNDLGAPSSTSVSGSDEVPLLLRPYLTSLTTGQYSIDPATNNYHFAAADTGKTVLVRYNFNKTIISQQENDLIPAGKIIHVGGTFQFHADGGVIYFTGPNNGKALTKVSGTPSVTGTYAVSGSGPATYTFAPGDVNAEVQITYQIQNNSIVPKGVSADLNFTLFEGMPSQSVWGVLATSFPGAALGYTGIAYVAYNGMQMGFSAEVQQNVFEVSTADGYGGGVVDCNPVQCILQVLTNPVWGLGAGPVPFPTSAIDNGTGGTWGKKPTTPGARLADSTAWSWFASNGFFISPVIDKQDGAAGLMSKWLEAGQCAAFMSEGLLKLVSYGDTSTAGNGCTWIAPTAFAAAVDDTCFLPRGEGEEPVKISTSPWQDAYNTVQINWDNRSNQYAPELTQEFDQAAINRYGSRIEDPQDFEFITTLAAATFAASMRVKRNVYTRNTYEFSLPYSYSYLECMDVLYISTSSQWAAGINNANLNIVNLPVRITKIVDNPGKDGLQITAEDYPFGVHQPTIYNKGIAAGNTQANLYADPGDTQAVVFEATNRLTQQKGNEIWIGALGQNAQWGGCNVWASMDGTTYKQVGTIETAARLGVLEAILPSGTDPDTTNTLIVTMAENSGALDAGSSADADAANTLCFVDGEILAYSACAISGQEQYTMGTYLRRGLMGSTISSHAAGSLFLRLDDAVFSFAYDPTWAGQTISLKFQSFNAFGNAAQDLSGLTATTFTIPGKNPGTIDASSGIVLNTPSNVVGAGPLGWVPIATSSDATLNYGNLGYTGMVAIPAGVNSTYFYARWTGYLIPLVTGQYKIGVNADDGATLYIGGQCAGAPDLAGAHSMAANLGYTQSASILLTAGVYYPIVVELAQSFGNYGIQLVWTPPKSAAQLIPSTCLSTSPTSVTGNLSGSWWNGTTGLFYPKGNGLTDPANKVLYGPPNAGGGTNVVNSVLPVSDNINAAGLFQAGNSFTGPGWIVGQAWLPGGATVNLAFNNSPSNGNVGYLFNINGNVGTPIGRIYICSSFTGVNYTQIGTEYVGNNAANVVGWVNFAIYIGLNGYKAIWINGNLAADVTDLTYTSAPAPGVATTIFYGYQTTPGKIAPAPIGTSGGSSFLNAQGSIIPNQPLPTLTFTTTTTSISLSWSAMTMLLSDGSTVTIASGAKSYSSLTANTNYFLYPYIDSIALTIQFANGTPPGTSASSSQSLQANEDGRFGLPPLQIKTPSSGTGGGGGGGASCPEASELVEVKGRGIIPVLDVELGDFIKGRSFKTGEDVYRPVISRTIEACAAWRIVNGHKITAAEPVWDGEKYTAAMQMPGNQLDMSIGIKVMLHVDTDEYDEANYWLVAGEPLLTHNQFIGS